MGARLTPLKECALWWEDERLLVVSDLHLEKGSSYAARGQLLPPYDTRATLRAVAALMDAFRPQTVISLGDSFHDRQAEARLSAEDVETIRALTASTDWIWVEGNHDPIPPKHLGGRAALEIKRGPLTFRHEPTLEAYDGEVAGHLHPCAKIRGRSGRHVRTRCFIQNGRRLVMPSFGAYTGGLNVCDAAFADVFAHEFSVIAAGRDDVYVTPLSRLAADRQVDAHWRL
ncbi:MAG: ligase-associated DNA damage response endonuclease PdeM [Pseudomonadota bacterium]